MSLFLVDELPDEESLTLAGEEARHAATVRRIRPGEQITVGDGAGGLALCEVTSVRPGRDAELELAVVQRWHEPKPRLRVVIAQALAKGDRGELAVEMATEAGADAIVPWQASRCVARWDGGPRGAKALARWRATARAATKQARRAWLPDIGEPVDTAGLAAIVAGTSASILLDGDARIGISEIDLPASGTLLVVVGPEGGITPSEQDSLAAAGAIAARLGPYVLRTSTAGPVALGAIGARSSRWA